jgi:hypothetical protein
MTVARQRSPLFTLAALDGNQLAGSRWAASDVRVPWNWYHAQSSLSTSLLKEQPIRRWSVSSGWLSHRGQRGSCWIPLAARLSTVRIFFVHDRPGEGLNLWFYSGFREATDLERRVGALELNFVGRSRCAFSIWRPLPYDFVPRLRVQCNIS